MRGLLDTSVFIADETGRGLDTARLPDESCVCVVTVAEMRAGVLAAPDTRTRARRLATLEAVAALEPLPVDTVAAGHWAAMRVALHEAGRRMNVNDLWIASVAAANGIPVVTQDRDYDVLSDLGLIGVLRV